MRPYEPETELFPFREPSREEALSLRYRLTTIVLLVIGIPMWLASAAIMVPAVMMLLTTGAEGMDGNGMFAAIVNVISTFTTLYALGRRNETIFARIPDPDKIT